LKAKEFQNVYCSKSPKFGNPSKDQTQEPKNMSNEIYTYAFKSALNEIQKAYPDVTSNLIFKNGKIIAKDETITEKTTNRTIAAFENIAKKADIIGDIKNITIQTSQGKINIANTEEFYSTTILSKEADEKYVNTLTRILIPIVIHLIEKIQPASIENETISLEQSDEPEEFTSETTEEPKEIVDDTEESPDETDEVEYYQNDQPELEAELEENSEKESGEETDQAEIETDDEPLIPEPPMTQLIVENIGGLLVSSDTVRVGQEVINQWNSLYGEQLNEVEIETLNGKTTRCKFKPIKKNKEAGKGIIKIPEKIQLTLKTAAGELVTIKPLVK
jgi:hypothetical protein